MTSPPSWLAGRARGTWILLVAVWLAAPRALEAQAVSPSSGRIVLAPTRRAADAIAIDAARRAARDLVAASVAAASPSRRSPLVAGVLGVVPGLGHLYAGEPGRAAAVAVVWFGSALVAFGTENKTANDAAGAVFLGSAVFSIADGAAAAGRYNRRHAQLADAGSAWAAASPR